MHTEMYDHNLVLTNRNITLLLFLLLLGTKEKQKLITPALLLFVLMHTSLQWSSYHNLALPYSVFSIPDSVLSSVLVLDVGVSANSLDPI